MTPTEESTYLRWLAKEIYGDCRIGARARLVIFAVLIGRAERITAKKGGS